MKDAKDLLPLARGNVWTGMPTFRWPAGELERGCVRRASRSRAEVGSALRLGLRQLPRSVHVDEFLLGQTPKHLLAAIHPSSSSESEPNPQPEDEPFCFATLVLRHALLRMLLHAIAAARKPRNLRWHLQGITREFYGCLWKK
jgi:hypothetical protein